MGLRDVDFHFYNRLKNRKIEPELSLAMYQGEAI